jgi:hypothetical protein
LGEGWRGCGERIGSEAVEVFGGCWCWAWTWVGVVVVVVGCVGLVPFGFGSEVCCGFEMVETLALGSDALPSICRCLPLLLGPSSGVAGRTSEGCPGLSVKPEDDDLCSETPALLSLVFNEPSPSRETAWLAPSEHQHHCTSSGAKGP